jgi:lysophospholipase L1-like esterase
MGSLGETDNWQQQRTTDNGLGLQRRTSWASIASWQSGSPRAMLTGVGEGHGRSRRTPVVLGVVAVVVVVALVGILLGLNASTPSRTVPVIGDSITFFAGRDIAAALKGEYRADVHGGIGKRIDEMLPELQTALGKHPHAVVVNLGTNDAQQEATHPDWRSGFTKMIAALSGSRCALVTNISTLIGHRASITAVAIDINGAIAAAAAAHPNIHIIDWNAAVHRADGATLLIPDRVHPSPAGQLTLAKLTRTALDKYCRAT